RIWRRRRAAQKRFSGRERLRGRYTRMSRDDMDERLRSEAYADLDSLSLDVTIDIPDIGRDVHKDFGGLSVDICVQDTLLQARESLNGSERLVLYSDGSMIKVGTPEVGMSFGVVRELDGGRC